MAQFSATANHPWNSNVRGRIPVFLKARQGRGKQKASCNDPQLASRTYVAETSEQKFKKKKKKKKRETERKEKSVGGEGKKRKRFAEPAAPTC